jgi:dihydroorotase
MPLYDWLIHGGRVIDPASSTDAVRDIAVSGGRIALIAERIDSALARDTYDASGQIVTPGWVDLHMHGYHLATPLGIPTDHYCLGRGVTTAVDAGSAGSSTFPGLRAFAAEPARTRLLAFVHISCAGLAYATIGSKTSIPGELETLRLADLESCIECVEANRDLVVGVKIRLTASLAENGRNEAEAFKRALRAAEAVRLPLMVHHVLSSVAYADCPGLLRAGDIYTHCFHGHANGILDDSRLRDEVIAARERGVIFDTGHGQGSFDWRVAETCAQLGFPPDTISTDLHSGNCEGPAYDLPTVVSKMLHIGMPLVEAIRRVTLEPARAIAWHDRIGALAIGREADVAAFSMDETPKELEDCGGVMRTVQRRLVPKAVWRAGVITL